MEGNATALDLFAGTVGVGVRSGVVVQSLGLEYRQFGFLWPTTRPKR